MAQLVERIGELLEVEVYVAALVIGEEARMSQYDLFQVFSILHPGRRHESDVAGGPLRDVEVDRLEEIDRASILAVGADHALQLSGVYRSASNDCARIFSATSIVFTASAKLEAGCCPVRRQSMNSRFLAWNPPKT